MPPMLNIVRITEQELAGELLVNTPFSWTMEKSRAALEETILYLGYGEISPYTLWLGLNTILARIYGKARYSSPDEAYRDFKSKRK